jgi:succinate dehydrogenase/fumarate reductase flavoprotein subunit
VHESQLGERVRERSVGDMIEQAREAGAVVREEPPYTSVLVQATVTQTLGGLHIDVRSRVFGTAEKIYAAGADAGGISSGGYSSGLAAAVVFGRIAAEEALSS